MNADLYLLPVSEGARLLLARLHDDVEDPDDVIAWEKGRPGAPPPFCWRLAGGYEPLMNALRRGRTAVTDDLAALTKLGVIRRAKRDGRSGWELLGTRAAEVVAVPSTSAQPDRTVRPAGQRSPNLLTPRSAPPDVERPPDVRPAGPPGPPSRTSVSAQPDHARARDVIKQEQHREAGRGGAANDRPSSATATSSRATTLPVQRTPQGARPEPPRPAPPQGPARALLFELVQQLDAMFTPADADGVVLESRRIRPDVETLRRLTELLTPPEDVDAAAWLERRIASVTAYVRDYAVICTADPEQAHNWGGPMLEPRLLKGQRSAWEVLERIVDRWREDQAAARASARVAAVEAARAEARAVEDRLDELEQLARHGEPAFARELRAAGQAAPPRRDHVADYAAARTAVEAARTAGREPTLAEIAAAVAAVPALDTDARNLEMPATPGLTPLPPLPPIRPAVEPPPRELSDDEEAEIRQRGRQREAAIGRVERQTVGQRIHEAIKRFRELARRDPTPEEAAEIRRRAGGQEATGT